VLIDCPAGIEQGFKNAIAGADKSVVVTTPETSAVRDADRIIGLLEKEENIEVPKLVVNRIRNHMMESGEMLDVDEIVSILAI
ncbi:septum site-determining protein MinD, partial [Staphylococcus sp. SIMBA_130]